MTIFTFANNVNTTLAGAVSPSATTITLASTANLPASIPAGEVLVITLNDVATRQNFEVVYATARTGATLTVLRAQEGTAALAWLTGDFAFSPPTAGQQESFGQIAAPNTWSGANTFTQPVVVPAAVSSNEAITLGQAESIFAAINGSPSQVFNVAPAVTANEAINLGQFVPILSGSGAFEIPMIAGGVPKNFIIQWGTSSIISTGTGISNLNVPLSTPFPTAHLFALANFGGVSPPSGDSCAGFPVSLSAVEISIFTQNPGTYAVSFISIGY
jgi:hypothetical protein